MTISINRLATIAEADLLDDGAQAVLLGLDEALQVTDLLPQGDNLPLDVPAPAGRVGSVWILHPPALGLRARCW